MSKLHSYASFIVFDAHTGAPLAIRRGTTPAQIKKARSQSIQNARYLTNEGRDVYVVESKPDPEVPWLMKGKIISGERLHKPSPAHPFIHQAKQQTLAARRRTRRSR